MASSGTAMDIPQQSMPLKQYYPPNSYPSYHTGSPTVGSISPASSVNSQQHYPPQSVNFNPGGTPAGGATTVMQNSPSGDSRLSGGSGIGYRPPSAQSSGYRLAKAVNESEGYLEPRSSGSSFQSPVAGGFLNKEHDSGVDIDHPKGSAHFDVRQSSGSDQSGRGSVNFNPNVAAGWSASDRPGNGSELNKDITKNGPLDVAPYRHDYEELPINKDRYAAYADADDNTQSNLSSSSHLRRQHDVNNTENPTAPACRHRQNPLYDAIIREDSKASSKSTPNHGVNRCLCLSIVLLTLLSFMAVILACIAISGVTASKQALYMISTPSYAELEDAYERIIELETKYQTLMEKYDAVSELIGRNGTFNVTIDQELTQHRTVLDGLSKASQSNLGSVQRVQGQLNQLEVRVNTQNSTLDELQTHMVALEASDVAMVMKKLTNHSREIKNMAMTVTQLESGFGSFKTEIRGIAQNISKMPGPVGPSGAGNLSRCEHKVIIKGTGIGDFLFQTAWIPTISDRQLYVILGLECSGNTVMTQLEAQTSDGFDQFRCSCSGASQLTEGQNRFCEMHYWRCPRIS